MAWLGVGGARRRRVRSTSPSRALRLAERLRSSSVQRTSASSRRRHRRRRHGRDRTRGAGEPFADALGRQAEGLDQRDRARRRRTEGGVRRANSAAHRARDVSPAARPRRGSTARAELRRPATRGRLDVIDDVGVTVRSPELRSEQALRHGLLLSVAAGGSVARSGVSSRAFAAAASARRPCRGSRSGCRTSGSGRSSGSRPRTGSRRASSPCPRPSPRSARSRAR